MVANAVEVNENPKVSIMIPPIKESSVQDQEFGNTVHLAMIGSTVPKDYIWKPEYWANVSKRFKPFDEVKLHYEDGSYWAWALVLSANHTGATLKKIMEVDLEPEVESNTGNKTRVDAGRYAVEYKGRIQKWVVIRKSDGVIVTDGFSQKSMAVQQAQQLSAGED